MWRGLKISKALSLYDLLLLVFNVDINAHCLEMAWKQNYIEFKTNL